MISFISPKSGNTLVEKNNRLETADGEHFPVINNIPRFVPIENYASAFGYQWKNFAKTQLDSYSNTTISKERLERCLGCKIDDLRGKTVLEVGSGAGRFTELFVKAGALTHSIDLSVAVEVNKENIGVAENYQIAQASVYEIPYPKESFDYVVCLGVIQHTPSSEKTIRSLFEMVKPGGVLVIDHYRLRLGYFFNPATYWRVVLKRLKPETSKKIVDTLVNFFFPLHWAFRNNSIAEWLVKRVSPVMTFIKDYPDISRDIHLEWSKLDSYDSLTDYYKRLLTLQKIRFILEKNSAKNIWMNLGGNGIESRCFKSID